MDTCPNCGSEIRPTARFCTSCGFRMPERSVDTASTSSAPAGSSSQASGWGIAGSDAVAAKEAPTVSATEPKFDTAGEAAAAQWQPVAAMPAATAMPETVVEPPVPAAEVAIPTGPIPDVIAENTINDMAENRVNIALFHIERLKQLVPDITGWSEQQASSVDTAISALEAALKGREDESDPYRALRETLKIAKRDPRDIDAMISLADRAGEIEDLLAAHDQYSVGLRQALFAIKPAAVNYVVEAKRRPVRKPPVRKAAPKQTAPVVSKESAAPSESTAPVPQGTSAANPE